MKVLEWLDNNIEEALMIFLLACMSIIMGIQVCSRYIFGNSLSWSEEITRYLFIWSGFISVSYCTKKCISIKIDQIAGFLPNKLQTIIKLIKYSVELLFFLYLIPYAWLYFKSAIDSGQTSPAVGIPMYIIQAAPLLSFILVSIRIIQEWINELKKLGGDRE